MKKLLEYDFPKELKEMSMKELELLTYEIRDFLIDSISKTGGHLAPNLGVVELTMALHKVFDSPKDKFIWDVGHQSYVHKILTGRARDFKSLRQTGGLSGFPKSQESDHDILNSGHSSNSLSFATGLFEARRLSGANHRIISIIGDGAMTGGMVYEALNNIGYKKGQMLIVLNDNGMSISPNTGGISHYLQLLTSTKRYKDVKNRVKSEVNDKLANKLHAIKNSIKYATLQSGAGHLFEAMGIKYIGPINGHDLKELISILEFIKDLNYPVLLHVVTKKGKGYKLAEEHPDKYHGIGPFNLNYLNEEKSNSNPKTKKIVDFSKAFGNAITEVAREDDKVVAITAAMPSGTGLADFRDHHPSKFFDVGIAEEHAITFAAGLAKGGYKPVCAIYSTFLQRAYDQIIEDVCLQRLPVIFAIDRAGNVGADGDTHNGHFDISYLSCIPDITMFAPATTQDVKPILEHALTLNSPAAIRYPRGGSSEDVAAILDGNYGWSNIRIKQGNIVDIWAVGTMAEIALKVCTRLESAGISTGLVIIRQIKPFSYKDNFNTSCSILATIEDGAIIGGYGSTLKGKVDEALSPEILNFGWKDTFVEHGNTADLRNKYGLSPEAIFERIMTSLEKKN